MSMGGLLTADTIELKAGERIDGKLKQVTAAGAVMEIGGAAITFPVAEVKAIYFGSGPVESTATEAKSVTNANPALDAIKGLQSVEASIAYTEYSRRVLDAQVQVDRFFNSNQGSSRLRHEVKIAMEFYNLASRVWNVQLFSRDDDRVLEYAGIAKDTKAAALLANCPLLQERIDLMIMGSNHPPNDPRTLGEIGRDLGEHKADLLWGCASSTLRRRRQLHRKNSNG